MKPEVGAQHRQVVAEGLTRTQMVAYAGASGDFHPFHHDETYATSHGFDRIFAHGMLTMGITGQALVAVFGPEGWTATPPTSSSRCGRGTRSPPS